MTRNDHLSRENVGKSAHLISKVVLFIGLRNVLLTYSCAPNMGKLCEKVSTPEATLW